MVILSLTDNGDRYFNKVSLLHVLFLITLYLISDIYMINYSADVYAYSKGFYFKLILCLLYLIGSKDNNISINPGASIQAAFHFSVSVLCIWMAITGFILEHVTLSKFTGIFLLFGVLSSFNLIDEIIKVIRLKSNNSGMYVFEIILKILLFSMFCLAVYLLFIGEWQWDIKPFYEW